LAALTAATRSRAPPQLAPHPQPRPPTWRIICARPTPPSEETNEKDNPGPAGDTGDRGRAVPDSENPTRVDKLLKQWIEDDKILDRERWRRGRWS